jgi:hypothetical protein
MQGRTADQRTRGRRKLLQLPDLALETRGFERARRHQDQPVGFERLLDEIVGAALDRCDRGFDVAVTRDHDDRRIRIVLLDLLEQLQPVEPAALQPDIEEHHVRTAARNFGQRLVAVARGPCRKSFVFENTGDQIADVRLVVDYQNVMCHGLDPLR